MNKNLHTKKITWFFASALFLIHARLKKAARKRSDMLSRMHFLLCAGYSLKQAVCLVLPCGKEIYAKHATIPEILVRCGLITESEQKFFAYTYTQGSSNETISAFCENAHTRETVRKKMMAAVLPGCVFCILLFGMILFMSVFVVPKLEPLALQQGIAFPLALRLLLRLRDVLLYHTGSLVVFLLLGAFGLRELLFFVKRSRALKRFFLQSFFLKSFMQEYYFLQWARLYTIASVLRIPRVLKVLLPALVVLEMPFSQNMQWFRGKKDFYKEVRACVFFLPHEMIDEFCRSAIPSNGVQALIRRSEQNLSHDAKHFALIEHAVLLIMAGVTAFITLSLAAFMRSIANGSV